MVEILYWGAVAVGFIVLAPAIVVIVVGLFGLGVIAVAIAFVAALEWLERKQ